MQIMQKSFVNFNGHALFALMRVDTRGLDLVAFPALSVRKKLPILFAHNYRVLNKNCEISKLSSQNSQSVIATFSECTSAPIDISLIRFPFVVWIYRGKIIFWKPHTSKIVIFQYFHDEKITTTLKTLRFILHPVSLLAAPLTGKDN